MTAWRSCSSLRTRRSQPRFAASQAWLPLGQRGVVVREKAEAEAEAEAGPGKSCCGVDGDRLL